jgi:hypothetical protein
MSNILKHANVVAIIFFCLHLSACGNIWTVISFSTKYEQPISGDRAKIRVVSFNGMVRAVPNSSCIDWRLPGAGVMATPTKGFANVNDQNLGMPIGQFSGLATSMGVVAVSELYIPAGKPIVLHYLSQGDIQNGANYQCFVSRSFIPVVNEDYEAVYKQDGSLCHFSIVRLSKNGGIDQLSPVTLYGAPLCRASDNF